MATEETENPATFDVEPEAKEEAQPPEQGAVAMLAQIQAQQLRLQALEQAVRAQQGGEEVLQASPSESVDEGGALLVFANKAARHVFAERVTTPACFHQITTVTLLDADAPMLSKASFLLTSLLLLMLQQMTLTSVAAGVSAPSCVDNNDCAAGSYCKMLTEERGFCLMCLRADGVTPFFGDGTALNATAYCATVPTDDPVCMACYDGNLPGDGWNIGWNMRMRFNAATNRMCGGDWAALILVASVVGLYVAGELRDIKLCQITFETRDGSSAPAWVQAALLALGAWRQFAFLGMLTHIVAMLVLHRGSDAISVCFNGVAVLFLLDVDVYLFEFWVPEKMRERMEEFGAPTVSEDDARYLAILKRYHAVLVAFFIFLAVLQTGRSGFGPDQNLTTFGVFLPGLADVVNRIRLKKDTPALGAAKLFFSFMVGGICSMGLVESMASAGWIVHFGQIFGETGEFAGPCPGPRNGEMCCSVSGDCP